MSWLGNVFKSVGDVSKVLVSAAFPGAGSYLSAQETNKAQAEAQRRANESNVALWQYQAAYNSPTAQMQRLRDAGLNPNLAYGQVAESRMASAPTMSAPEYKVPEWKGQSLLQSLSEYAQVVNMQAQNALIRAQADKVASEAVAARSNAEYAAYENKQLMRTGLLKNDTLGLKYFLRQGIDRFSELGGYADRSALWQMMKDYSEKFGEGFQKFKSLRPIEKRLR